MLSPKERLLNVIYRKEIDRPPCICPGGMMNMITAELLEYAGVSFPEAHMDSKLMADLALAAYESGCFENYGVPFCMTIEAEDFGAKVDMGSNVYEPHVIKYSINSVKEWREIPQINFNKGRPKVVLDAIKILNSKTNDVPIIGNLTGPVSTASSIMEPVTFYKELRKNNQEAHAFMNFVTEQLIIFAQKQIDAGADIIAISDPSGTGEILGPRLFEEFTVKYINRIIESIQNKNLGTIVHICGQMRSVYKEVNKIKSDVLSFDSFISIKEARKHLQDRLIMGNINTYAIEFSEGEKVKELTKKCIGDGVDIVSPACGLSMKSPLKNIKAMLECLKMGDEQ